MKIWAHMLVKNEEKYLWYAVLSVVDYVDKVLLWDTGSTDKTLEICKKFQEKFPEKIDFRQVKISSAEEFPKVRQEMLDATDADWFLVVDGDEVWWEGSIKKVIVAIKKKGDQIESVAVPMIYPIGDIYHRQEEAAGGYHLVGKRGHISLRGVNKNIPGLSASKPHGTFGWTDIDGKMIQDRDPQKVFFVEAPYMHFSHLPRAGSVEDEKRVVKRPQKLKHELGEAFPKDYYYPEVFFRKSPKIVPSPWERMDSGFYLRALAETPFRKIKRRLLRPKVGY